MQISWRKNPRTEDGWFKRTAISLLVAVGGFFATLPVAFLIVLNHLKHAYPNDTQNFLGAMTYAVVIGIVIAAMCFTGMMVILMMFGLRGKGAAA
jgi:uncharacterized BrkB/YihY/UPF0761 family membrane protein